MSGIGKVRTLIRLAAGALRAAGKPKVFCVGMNKTGTTTLGRALVEMGYSLGDQHTAERLIHDWARRDFRRLFQYCLTAQAFQDVPFSWPLTFQAVDQRFPGSKFIFSVRDPEDWYHSLINFHSIIIGHGRIPTTQDLKDATYVYRGWAYEARFMHSAVPEDDPYNRDILIQEFKVHNQAVQEHFSQRPGDLLVLDVREPGAYDRLCDFLGKARTGRELPWENRTSDKAAQLAGKAGVSK